MEEKLLYITSNIAPFRVDLLDELSSYFSKIGLCYYNEIDKDVNPKYVQKRPKNVYLIKLSKGKYLSSYKLISNSKYIIFDGYSGKDKVILILLCQIFRKPYMISIDGIIEKNQNKLKQIVKKKLLSKARTIFSTNKNTDCIIKSIYPGANISRHIFSTLNDSDIRNIKKTLNINKYNVNSSMKNILFVGKFLPTKGVKEFIYCAKKDMQNRYIMVGGTKEQLLKLGLDIPNNIEIHHFLEKKDVLSIMCFSDLFVLPTYSDVWGLVIVEALSCGIPVITTDKCNAGQEFIEDGKNGYIIPVKGEKKLQTKIKNALMMDKNFVKNYNFNIMKNYTIEQSAKEMQKNIKKKGN